MGSGEGSWFPAQYSRPRLSPSENGGLGRRQNSPIHLPCLLSARGQICKGVLTLRRPQESQARCPAIQNDKAC